MRARGGGGTRRSSISAAPRGSGSLELAKSGTPGVGLNRGWAKEGQRGTRKPLVGLSGFGGVWNVEGNSGGGSALQHIAGARRLSREDGPRAMLACQKGRVDVGGPHRAPD